MIPSIKKILTILVERLGIDIFFRSLKHPSVIILILFNLIPIIGVFFFNWKEIDVLVMYWVESVVIGIYNILKILMSKNVYGEYQRTMSQKFMTKGFLTISSMAMAFFFLFHYGFFTYGHLLFLGVFNIITGDPSSNKALNIYQGQGILNRSMIIFFVVLMISHGFSFIYDFVRKKEYLNTNASDQMYAPYKRIFALQITLIFGTFIASFYSKYLIVLFVIAKIYFEVLLYYKS